MNKVKFAVVDIFSLVDEGVALIGDVIEGVLKPGMELNLSDKKFVVLRIEGEKGKQFSELDVEISKAQKLEPSVILQGATKEELHAAKIWERTTVEFQVND